MNKIQTKDEIDITLQNIINHLDLKCRKCRGSCVIRNKKNNFYKRCVFSLCQMEESIFKGSIFYYKKLDKYQVVYILRMWFSRVPVKAISELLYISTNTVFSYLKKALKLIEHKYLNSIGMIGGPNIIVEIDESKFGRRKYYRGHKVEGVWVLGLVERTDKRRIILIPVKDRKSTTLIEIIKKYVHPESIIYTDGWKGYTTIKDNFLIHKSVNHSISFVDFINNVHTNTIEGNWAGVKQDLPIQYRTKDRIMLYLIRFMIKRNRTEDAFEEFIKFLF